MEIFESFGLDQELTKDAYWVNEVVFWTTDGDGRIRRTSRTPDVMPGMSWKHHVIMNQAHLNALMVGDIEKSGRKVEYDLAVNDVQVENGLVDDCTAYPVTATVDDVRTGEKCTIKAKYLMV